MKSMIRTDIGRVQYVREGDHAVPFVSNGHTASAKTKIEEIIIEVGLAIRSSRDVYGAIVTGKKLASFTGFSSLEVTLIITAISELSRNILNYAGSGQIVISSVYQAPRYGIVIIARDEGPGIPDTDIAMQDGYSTSRQLGKGLPAVRKLMDEFQIISKVGYGTTVIAKKWL